MENQEQEEIKLLTGEGYGFETSLFGKKMRWSIKKIPMGKMLRLSKIFIQIKIDEEAISSEDLSVQIPAQYESVRNNAELCAKAIAQAVDSKFPKWFLKWHFLNTLTSSDVKSIAFELLKFSDYQNFMISMALMNGNRPTKAMPIEKTV